MQQALKEVRLKMRKAKRVTPIGAKLIRLTKGLALPEYFKPTLKACKYDFTGYTKKAIEVGDLLKIDYMLGYVELASTQQEMEEAIQKARNINLRVHRGKSM